MLNLLEYIITAVDLLCTPFGLNFVLFKVLVHRLRNNLLNKF